MKTNNQEITAEIVNSSESLTDLLLIIQGKDWSLSLVGERMIHFQNEFAKRMMRGFMDRIVSLEDLTYDQVQLVKTIKEIYSNLKL